MKLVYGAILEYGRESNSSFLFREKRSFFSSTKEKERRVVDSGRVSRFKIVVPLFNITVSNDSNEIKR